VSRNTATDVVNKADIIMEIREKGLLLSAMFWETKLGSYFLMKWGINRRPGIRRKAGKVIRLNIPKTTINARRAEATTEER
jgi:hypothetical protein